MVLSVMTRQKSAVQMIQNNQVLRLYFFLYGQVDTVQLLIAVSIAQGHPSVRDKNPCDLIGNTIKICKDV